MRRAIIGLLRKILATRLFTSSAQRYRRPMIPTLSRASSVLVGTAAFALLAPHAAVSQGRIEIVNFQSVTFPGSLFTPPFMAAPQEGSPAMIFGILRLPETTDRVPAVVITHGCSGITGAETYWAESLIQLGVATFVVNSFVGRSIPRVCSGPHTISTASVLTDVYRARDLLAEHPRIDPSRIAVLGFSFGGRNALWAASPRFQQRYGPGLSPFAAHLAFYPTGCHIKLIDEDRVADVPIRIFHGAADDATIIGRCREYVARLRNAGRDVALFEYVGAKHWFDNADLANRQTATGFLNYSKCTFLEQDDKIIDVVTGGPAGTGSPCVVSEGSFGYNPAAREQATADVQNFLRSLFKL
ncbi:dienelactone hydrolase family protein [Bradyrhizobium sp. AUGA SZCCT0169]|uniref:dienelactone hydrolase family protein n=1 Tax=Bradyrhizobium sp. AUGA SZCCT0169 TaxID=2807663 RepID=UPI001BA5EE6A|nr:dienelactone hydrolase family protein [Bradyrhizobium sp. AUGA SZCCT0169]MBR1246976.1 dienelactone hydrolase family protein [Bradyrhizobium sp. AUGA SZCCT0169]